MHQGRRFERYECLSGCEFMTESRSAQPFGVSKNSSNVAALRRNFASTSTTKNRASSVDARCSANSEQSARARCRPSYERTRTRSIPPCHRFFVELIPFGRESRKTADGFEQPCCRTSARSGFEILSRALGTASYAAPSSYCAIPLHFATLL